jgi:hypothetical protein
VDGPLLLATVFDPLKPLSFLRAGKTVRYARVMRVLRLARLRRLVESVHIIEEIINSQSFAVCNTIMLNVICVLMLCHYLACIWCALGQASDTCWIVFHDLDAAPTSTVYLAALHWALTQVTPGASLLLSHSTGEYVFNVFVLVFGLMIFSAAISSIIVAVNNQTNLNSKYNSQRCSMRRFFRQGKYARKVGCASDALC